MTTTDRRAAVAIRLLAALAWTAGVAGCGPAAPPPEPPPPEPEEPAPPPVSPACRAAAEQPPPSDVIDLRSTGPSAVAGRSRQVVREALEARKPRFRYCRDAAVREGADPSAGIALRFTIVPSGEVCEAEVLSNPSGSDTFAACALAVLRGLEFGENARVGESDYRPAVRVIYAFQGTGVD